MKQLSLLFSLIFVCCVLRIQAQEISKTDRAFQENLIEKAVEAAKKAYDIAPIQDLIESGQLTWPEAQASAYIAKAFVLKRIHKRALRKYEHEAEITDPGVIEILDSYKRGIECCEKCRLQYKVGRYEFMESIDHKSKLFSEDLAELERAGYKKGIRGPVVGLQLMAQSDGIWLGAEVAAWGGLQPAWHFKTEKQRKFKNNSFAANAMSIAYLRSLDQNINDISFSLFQITAPIYINLTRIGVYAGKDTPLDNEFYYRPEIGIGWGRISAGYAHNFVFYKSARPFAAKHLFSLHYLTPIASNR